jgi:hypothetical protein
MTRMKIEQRINLKFLVKLKEKRSANEEAIDALEASFKNSIELYYT